MSDMKDKFLVNSLVSDYQKLTQDIMMYENQLESRDSKWQTIGGIKNPEFKEERRREFIDNKISDLTNQRNRIWSFLSVQFKNNTLIRNKNYKQLQKLNQDLSKITKTIADKKEAMENSQGFLGKQVREHEILKYKNMKDRELIYLHALGLVTLLICLGLLSAVVTGKMPLKNMIIGCGIILVLFLLYLVKVVYIDNVNRNIRYGDEIDFNKPTKEQSTDEVSIDSGEGGCARNAAVPEFLPQAESDELLEQVKQTANVNNNTCKS
jgi:hypothetical protein